MGRLRCGSRGAAGFRAPIRVLEEAGVAEAAAQLEGVGRRDERNRETTVMSALNLLCAYWHPQVVAAKDEISPRALLDGGANTVYVIAVVTGTRSRDGEPVHEVHSGDSVENLPGERHWHGAAPDHVMTHIAVYAEDPDAGAETSWQEPVSEQSYAAL